MSSAQNHHGDPLRFFRLKPLRSARVSEISETTAASETVPEERVNFHIGNPVQDEQLSSAYLRMTLGLDIRDSGLHERDLGALRTELGWNEDDQPKIEFLRALIKKSAPYTPRGGFARNNPPPIIKALTDWLQQQQDALSYDLGNVTGRREIILTTGGISEAVRMLLHAASAYLASLPASIIAFGPVPPIDMPAFPHLRFAQLPDDEHAAVAELDQRFAAEPETPAFVLLTVIPSEEMRRSLRRISTLAPVVFVEGNDAPNRLSLGREAKLVNRVLRLLTPGIFDPSWSSLATTFVLGNADILRVLESIHFQLKGTPSASEIELLEYLLAQKPSGITVRSSEPMEVEPPFEGLFPGTDAGSSFVTHGTRAIERLSLLAHDRIQHAADTLSRISSDAAHLVDRMHVRTMLSVHDRFAGVDSRVLLDDLPGSCTSAEWRKDIENSFLAMFTRHHPEYRQECCLAVSGSSRTGLGLLGFHCGIREVVFPDLSWSYEHCFPTVAVVPLTPAFEIDAGAILDTVRGKVRMDPEWRTYGAVVLNNPHNATGRVFNGETIGSLLVGLLELGVFVVDDLSYQNVAPSTERVKIPTLRQRANELVRMGSITEEQADRVVTVHSVSKTDCLAGARLSVAEIRDQELYQRFAAAAASIAPNLGALLMTYLFYRNGSETAEAYWSLRNRIFHERSNALLTAATQLPNERNMFDLRLVPPTGSMYPLLVVGRFPAGLSLDWLASGLARQGIGMLPLSTFARTEEGFESARTTFRLTLGGIDNAAVLQNKTRRVLIDLNQLIAEEASRYNRKRVAAPLLPVPRHRTDAWQIVEHEITGVCRALAFSVRNEFESDAERLEFAETYTRQRLEVFRQRAEERAAIRNAAVDAFHADPATLINRLETEFYKDSLARRFEVFHDRLYDRTVHPTQMYSIHTERLLDTVVQSVIENRVVSSRRVYEAARSLSDEFFGRNVAVSSGEESDEILLDLDALAAAELHEYFRTGITDRRFLSFWSDWDGSNRPSGQGHRLIATTLMAGVTRLSALLRLVHEADPAVSIDEPLQAALESLAERNRKFFRLLNDITQLTHQLEKRYRGVLPFTVRPGMVRNIGMKLHVARDPLRLLWQHNDRLERRMLEMRRERREALEEYFSLNKLLRKQIRILLPVIRQQTDNVRLLAAAGTYTDPLQRTVITPRIHQAMITAQDQFSIDTTVHNIHEINELSGRYGTPGMILALQISMSSKAEALISLDRKMRAERERVLRRQTTLELPSVQLIPLFEDLQAIESIPAYLGKVWDYAHQSRRIAQETKDRFAEIIPEVFIAGSDISQQVGQAAGGALYRKAKQGFVTWLAEHGLAGRLRLKMGSGEPMQRQGGYYAPRSGTAAFTGSASTIRNTGIPLPPAARKSTEYATTPLMGIFAGSDLRTMQSAVSEQFRFLPVAEFIDILHHLRIAQRRHAADLARAAESLTESRFLVRKRGAREIERLTVGVSDPVFERFLGLATEDFRQILYGREEDVLGIHIVSYFLARTMPQLRDRPTVRPTGGSDAERGQKILGQIARMIPLSRHGSLLRAIAHNQAQTAVLGINQLTTGVFRAMQRFAQLEFKEGDAATLLIDRVLPHLPVYEILQTLRWYHDTNLPWLKALEPAFPSGNSALLALREDNDSIQKFLGILQQELVRRHGLDVSDFFDPGGFMSSLLPFLRPDLAVLLQQDLFNTDESVLLGSVRGAVSREWSDAIRSALAEPVSLRNWRNRIWDILHPTIFGQVQSFAELATALHSLSSTQIAEIPSARGGQFKISSELTQFLSSHGHNDELRDFLGATLRYLAGMAEGMVDVPVAIVRSLQEVERIARIEEHAVKPAQLDRIRYYLLRIARLTGENG